MERPNIQSLSDDPFLSVLVCTHNPRGEYLSRTLDALRAQTLDRAQWELFLIDNASSTAISKLHDISWHEHGRNLSVDIVGKTHAIAAGTRKAKGSIIVIVDDDNILDSNYLSEAKRFLAEFPFIGVAAGVVKGSYGRPPPLWIRTYLPFLAIGDQGDRFLYALTPDRSLLSAGAGMVIRKQIVEYYLNTIENNPIRKSLDPVGNRLSRCGDIDMGLCAYEVGFAKSYSPTLRLTHLIPTERLSLSYMRRLREEGEYSDTLLNSSRGVPAGNIYFDFVRGCFKALRLSVKERVLLWQQLVVEWAILRGRRKASEDFRSSNSVLLDMPTIK